MERAQRLAEFWSWVPAFRVVAETLHLPTAAARLHVSPSALSRSIRLLEENLGQPLFTRAGGRLYLNEAGERFLAAVRDGMRLIDDGLCALTPAQRTGPLHLSTVEVLAHAVMPAIGQLRRQSPELLLYLHHHPLTDAAALLLRGELDLLLVPEPLQHHRLRVDPIGSAGNGIYCGAAHPLFRARRPTLERLLAHPFAGPITGDAGLPSHRWPAELRRHVSLYTNQLGVALDVAVSGQLLAVLPDRVAVPQVAQGALRRLPFDVVPPTTFFAVTRPTLVGGGVAEQIVELVRAELARPEGR